MAGANRQCFYRFNDRLAVFQDSAADKQHWEKRWSRADVRNLLARYSSGKLDEFEDIFTRYLPKDLPVLEAGCGNGQLVMALAARGYQVQGLDYAEATIARIRDAAPQLTVRTGDIYHLDVPAGTYGGYISIGLFEHNPAGPQEALKETRRVLHPQGVALISVPYLNSKRTRLLKHAPSTPGTQTPDGLNFYQYYFSREEFAGHIERAGLKVVECHPYGVYTGLVRDSAFWKRLERRGFFLWPLHHRFIRWCANAPGRLRFRAAHMLMFACKRAETA
jgi:SAM-dependent methyltransferase